MGVITVQDSDISVNPVHIPSHCSAPVVDVLNSPLRFLKSLHNMQKIISPQLPCVWCGLLVQESQCRVSMGCSWVCIEDTRWQYGCIILSTSIPIYTFCIFLTYCVLAPCSLSHIHWQIQIQTKKPSETYCNVICQSFFRVYSIFGCVCVQLMLGGMLRGTLMAMMNGWEGERAARCGVDCSASPQSSPILLHLLLLHVHHGGLGCVWQFILRCLHTATRQLPL